MDNRLYYGDNLDILRKHIESESVDLIYLDPPFNSKADYNILYKEPTGESSKAQITAFEDSWHWTEDAERTFQEIVHTAPAKVVDMMRAFRGFVGLNDMMAYLTMMCIRLIELRRVLKETGSIYLHCDPTASHYLKIMMDTVFGKKNFNNEIIWYYRRWSAATNRFQRIHDVILFFSKGASRKFNMLYEEYTIGTLKRWKGIKRRTTVLSDGTLSQEEDKEGVKGANMGDVWQISIINSQAKERLGYPTQKPEALLERIIIASSDPGDVVLDPFCGCGTSIAVSQKLRRTWIGIDITHLSINLIKIRLSDMFKLKSKKDYLVIGEPEDIQGARNLALSNRYQFQWWALSLICARPFNEKKKGADTGIDGIIYFSDETNKLKKAVVQIKSGHTSVKDIRDLGHVIEREKAEIGVFVTLDAPTKNMCSEAIVKGFYRSPTWNKDYPRIQILTIDDLFSGKQPNIPATIPSTKTAKRVSPEEQLGLDI